MRANTSEDTLENLKKLALEKDRLTSVVVTQSVEGALKTAEHEYGLSGRDSHMSCSRYRVVFSSSRSSGALGTFGGIKPKLGEGVKQMFDRSLPIVASNRFHWV